VRCVAAQSKVLSFRNLPIPPFRAVDTHLIGTHSLRRLWVTAKLVALVGSRHGWGVATGVCSRAMHSLRQSLARVVDHGRSIVLMVSIAVHPHG